MNHHVHVLVLYNPILTEGVTIDGDNPDHIMWIYERAQERADEYGIQGVTYRLTQGKMQAIIYCDLE